MNVVVIGLGSMGKRRIRLIRQYDASYRIIGVDSNSGRCIDATKEFGIVTYSELSDALKAVQFDCAFVCSSPLSHASLVTECLESGMHVFTELNLVADDYEKNINLAEENNLTLFLSSTFLFRDDIRRIEQELVESDCLCNYSYHVGQYLPDWHPWEDYRNFFVCQKRTNACREIMAIELPWLTRTFGDIESVKVLKGKNTDLDVDYPDNYLLLLVHESGHKGMMAIDIMTRMAVRKFELFGKNIYLTWDGHPETLYKYDIDKKTMVQIKSYSTIDQEEGYQDFVIENAYYSEIESFFNCVQRDLDAPYCFQDDLEVLQIIDEIEA